MLVSSRYNPEPLARLGCCVRLVAVPVMLLFAGLMGAAAYGDDFAAHQNRAPRVVTARAEKGAVVRALFAAVRVGYPPDRLFLRAFKRERQLEVWAGGASGALALVTTFPICALSGGLGPKRQQGDMQIPEGAYIIDRFNTASNFYLSLGVSYPNASDRILGIKGRLGGDIFIHGDCVTIGCLPLTDEVIKELYLIALDTYINGQREIPVHIFPRRMDAAGMCELKQMAGDDGALWMFWQVLAPVYAGFEARHVVPRVKVDPRSGAYVVAP